jgi:hypothetical protein
MRDATIIHGNKLLEVIRYELKSALAKEQAAASEEAEFYLVNLLNEYHMAGNVPILADESRPLGVLFMEALSKTPTEKAALLKRIGDGTLIALGFYEDSIRRSIVDTSYYMNIGGSAYDALADIAIGDTPFVDIYAELAAKFSRIVSALSWIAPWNRAGSDAELLSIYKRWLESGDAKLKGLLEREGIDTDEL